MATAADVVVVGRAGADGDVTAEVETGAVVVGAAVVAGGAGRFEHATVTSRTRTASWDRRRFGGPDTPLFKRRPINP